LTGNQVMKCFAGIDDGFFRRGWRETLLVLAAHCLTDSGDLCPCLVASTTVTIDGMDVTDKAVSLVEEAKRSLSLGAVLVDTVVFAGFNILDAKRLYRETGVPVIVVYWYPPNREAVESALRRHFEDWRRRLNLLKDVWDKLIALECSKGKLLVAPYGVSAEDAWSIVCDLQVYTRQPEPLFTAHVIASSLSRRKGLSHNDA